MPRLASSRSYLVTGLVVALALALPATARASGVVSFASPVISRV